MEKKKKKKSSMKKACSIMLKGNKFAYFFYYFVLVIALLFYILGTYTTKALIDAINKEAFETMDNLEKLYFNAFGGYDYLTNNLWMFAIILIIFALISGGLNSFRFIYRARTSVRMGKNLQDALFYKVERLPYKVVKSKKNGDILQTCTRDEESFRNLLTNHAYSISYNLCIVVLAFLVLAITNIQMALITMSLMPFLFIYTFLIKKHIRKRYRVTDDSEGEMTSKIEENLSAVRVVKAFNNEEYEINDFENYINDYRNKFLNWKKLSVFFISSSDIFIFMQILLTSIFGFYLTYKHAIDPTTGITVGTLAISFTYANLIVWPVRQTANVLGEMERSYAALERISEILDEPIEDIYTGSTPEIKGGIEFKNVSFKFDDSDTNLLNNVSFKINPGDTVAIMGKTGSGKSTLAYLLNRLYDVSEGEILVDNTPINEIQKSHLRKNISIILQEPFLFSKTIKDNLSIGRKGISDKDIEDATKISQVHDSIEKFHEGYETPVGERGVTLSGGQKQRIAIARTLVLNSPVLVFDDSLSAVDTETDFNIRKALKNRNSSSTTILITHRVATAKDADLIIVLNDGVIEMMGKHEDLIQKEGMYKRIYQIQTKME